MEDLVILEKLEKFEINYWKVNSPLKNGHILAFFRFALKRLWKAPWWFWLIEKLSETTVFDVWHTVELIFVSFWKLFFEEFYLLCIYMAFWVETLRRIYRGFQIRSGVGWELDFKTQKSILIIYCHILHGRFGDFY